MVTSTRPRLVLAFAFYSMKVRPQLAKLKELSRRAQIRDAKTIVSKPKERKRAVFARKWQYRLLLRMSLWYLPTKKQHDRATIVIKIPSRKKETLQKAVPSPVRTVFIYPAQPTTINPTIATAKLDTMQAMKRFLLPSNGILSFVTLSNLERQKLTSSARGFFFD